MLPRSAAFVLTLATALTMAGQPAVAQSDSIFENPEEQDIWGNGTAGGSGSALDAANPMDLINRLRRSSAMEEATPPSEAIDAALNDFQQISP